MKGPLKGLTSRPGWLGKALRWLLLAASLVSVALVLSPDLAGLRRLSHRTDAGVPIDPAPTETSYPSAVAPGATSDLVMVQDLAMLEPALPPGDEVWQPSDSSEAWSEAEAALTDAGALDCVIDPYQIIDVGSAVTGIIKTVHVERSDRVKAGAVLVAKLSMGALAQGDRWFGGRTRNPWNTEQGSSGSSAGPGSATAAGCVGFSGSPRSISNEW